MLEKEQLWCRGEPDAQMIWLRTCSQSRSSNSSHSDRFLSHTHSPCWRLECGNFVFKRQIASHWLSLHWLDMLLSGISHSILSAKPDDITSHVVKYGVDKNGTFPFNHFHPCSYKIHRGKVMRLLSESFTVILFIFYHLFTSWAPLWHRSPHRSVEQRQSFVLSCFQQWQIKFNNIFPSRNSVSVT